jgi:hypothetical protein
MPNERHPDLEIYIKNTTIQQILNWLELHCQTVNTQFKSDNHIELQLQFGNKLIEASLQQKVSGKAWSSLWLKTNATLWDTDLDCALVAAAQMQTQIRCIEASWSDDQSKDLEGDHWWKIEDGQQELISWKG